MRTSGLAFSLLLSLALNACSDGGGGGGDGGADGSRLDATSDGNREGGASLDGSGGDGTGPFDATLGGDGGDGGDAQAPLCRTSDDCAPGLLCQGGHCLPVTMTCASNNDCNNDSRCDLASHTCVPYHSGETDSTCVRDIRPGVFAPVVQCAFAAAPAGDPYPNNLHVLSTPMVADLRVYRASPDDPARPSIIAVFDDGVDGSSEQPTGVLRILDGRTCVQQDVLTEQLTSHSSPPAVADLDNDGVPEIVAFKAGGGLVAYRYDRTMSVEPGPDGMVRAGQWRVWWRSSDTAGAPYNPAGGGWAGPTIADIDNDGLPEVVRFGMVFDGRTGRLRGGMSQAAAMAGTNNGAFSVLLDVDEDDQVELVTSEGVFGWNSASNDWVRESYNTLRCPGGAGCAPGHVAVADLGPYTGGSITDPGLPEIAIVSAGTVRIVTIDGRTVFGPIALPGGGHGGPPTIADFDGDGLREIASAGAHNYVVFDPDCAATPTRPGGRCGTSRTDGVLWAQPSQDASSNVTGSTSFDFEADGAVEAVYADECFARVYNGATGEVLFSQHHSSCTWYENPVVADVDGDLRAEIVVGSNFNCGDPTTGIACPSATPDADHLDPLYVGLRCRSSADCPTGTCDTGFCRCTMDSQCCSSSAAECTYRCRPPPMGTPGTGNTCRAARPVGVRGIRVYSDLADRWVNSRMLWNQHTYNVTNVGDDLLVPRSSAVQRNWRVSGLNNFRTNVQGNANTAASPDATTGAGTVECTDTGTAIVRALACNRGTAPLADSLQVAFYDGDPAAGGTRICDSSSVRMLAPGACVTLQCNWPTPPTRTPTTVYIRIDDNMTTTECHENNNLGTIPNVVCRPIG